MKILAALLLLFLPSLLFAQTPQQDFFSIASDAFDKQPENYLAPIKAINNGKTDTVDHMGLNMWQQVMMSYESYIANYDSVLYYSDRTQLRQVYTQQVTCDTAFVKEHSLVNAADYISGIATQHQVIMINEAHHLPYHRAFVLPMLKKFYASGYRYLALETLDDTAINQKQYPDHFSGTYSNEPLYGEMIREALKLHFKLIKYESGIPCDHKGSDPMYCLRFRDSLMAVKLASVIKNDPQAKMLVYAGYAHIFKSSPDGWKKMAQYFKEMSGIEPFSIDLTSQIEHLHPQLDEKEFTAVNNLAHITYPVIALKNNQPWHGRYVDATVLFPHYLSGDKRPSFYSIDGLRAFYSIKKLHPKTGQLIQAFYADEKPGARIPADQFVFSNNGEGLYLFKGKYLLDIKDKNGILIKESAVDVR
jgi:hypothetical protein